MALPAVRIFLGAASENDRYLKGLAAALEPDARVDYWRQVSRPGVPILESLRREATAVDFAAFIWGREDRTTSRKRATASPRDNVVYEAGLFAGYLGSERTFVIQAPDTKSPTDYLGVTTIPQTTVDSVAARVKETMTALGPTPTSSIVGEWWQLVTSGYMGSSVVSFFSIEIQHDTRVIAMRGTSWDLSGLSVATWHCPAAAFEERTLTLHYSWEGVHTREEGVPEYFGTGDISFQREPIDGSSSSSPKSLNRPTVLRRARYFRAEPEDARIVNGKDVDARRRLIEQRLRDRTAVEGT
jgi:CAP12/Pycsar effector protein, TIR domain